MTQQPDTSEAQPVFPALKVVEPDVDAENPWSDDVLDRKEVADRLTSIVRGQAAPFVISLDGRWGTGKTFLLKRWAQDLRNQDPTWQAIYYNAWEDDFAEDPLLAIIGQLSGHLSEGFGERASKLVEVAGPLLYYGASLAALVGAGISLPPRPTGSDDSPSEKLNAYQKKRVAKDDLRESLGGLASEVREETGQPLVFIIDELDRCRPTFAIELLERVKHIFDVPNIVFVFGVNRSELVKSLKSVYGEIEAATYIQRFFDQEFTLPEPDRERFAIHLIERFRLRDFLSSMASQRFNHIVEFDNINAGLPPILSGLPLSLRDIDRCVRTVALACNDLRPGSSLFVPVLVLLVAVRTVNYDLYHRFMQREVPGAALIDYLDEHWRSDRVFATEALERQRWRRAWLEAAAYCIDSKGLAFRQLQNRRDKKSLAQPSVLTARTAAADPDTDEGRKWIDDLLRIISGWDVADHRGAREALGSRIDLYFNDGGR